MWTRIINVKERDSSIYNYNGGTGRRKGLPRNSISTMLRSTETSARRPRSRCAKSWRASRPGRRNEPECASWSKSSEVAYLQVVSRNALRGVVREGLTPGPDEAVSNITKRKLKWQEYTSNGTSNYHDWDAFHGDELLGKLYNNGRNKYYLNIDVGGSQHHAPPCAPSTWRAGRSCGC